MIWNAIYISFQGDIDSRMMSALLMGMNRAYPYAKLEEKTISEHLDTIYKIVHHANFNVSLQALCLLQQVSDFTNNVADRWEQQKFELV